MPSFESVSGPKTDKWLVRTVALLLISIGITLILSNGEQMKILGVLSALSIFIIDAYYSLAGRIRALYMADGAINLGLLATWLLLY
ncbi:hypothetical protein CYG49_01680 [Candidatus Saccharibacteria bacterium]|nr:MAG: hypothetical protein CYG49_01680 [Candidatus Saccharibacteria bacterium]